MATDDSLVRARPKSTILDGIARSPGRKPVPEAEDDAGADVESWDEVDVLPAAGSPYDAAYARPGNKPEMTLHVLFSNGFSEGIAWSNYDGVRLIASDLPGGGLVLVVRFAGLEPVELWIYGINLFKLRVCIGRQRIAWIREQPSKRGFEAATPRNTAEIITRIVIKPFAPARQASAAGQAD